MSSGQWHKRLEDLLMGPMPRKAQVQVLSDLRLYPRGLSMSDEVARLERMGRMGHAAARWPTATVRASTPVASRNAPPTVYQQGMACASKQATLGQGTTRAKPNRPQMGGDEPERAYHPGTAVPVILMMAASWCLRLAPSVGV